MECSVMSCSIRIGMVLMAWCVCFFVAADAASGKTKRATVLFIFDSSASMSGPIGDGKRKIDIAKEAIISIVDQLPQHYRLGLIYFQGECKFVVSDLTKVSGKAERRLLKKEVSRLEPLGDTPLAEAIVYAKKVIEADKQRKGAVHVVILSDGADSCGGSPCDEVKKMAAQGIKITFHTIGLQVDPTVKEELDCVASEGGGKSFTAQDTQDLVEALGAIKKAIDGQGRSKKSDDKGAPFFRPAD